MLPSQLNSSNAKNILGIIASYGIMLVFVIQMFLVIKSVYDSFNISNAFAGSVAVIMCLVVIDQAKRFIVELVYDIKDN